MGSDLVIHGTLHCHCIAMHCIEWYMVHDRIDACLSSESKLWNDSKEESTKWIELEDNRQHVLLFYMTKEIFLNFHLFIVTQQSGTVTLFWISGGDWADPEQRACLAMEMCSWQRVGDATLRLPQPAEIKHKRCRETESPANCSTVVQCHCFRDHDYMIKSHCPLTDLISYTVFLSLNLSSYNLLFNMKHNSRTNFHLPLQEFQLSL